MDIKEKIKEAHEQKNQMVVQLQKLRQVIVQNETAVIKLIGKIEGLEEALPEKEEKASGAK